MMKISDTSQSTFKAPASAVGATTGGCYDDSACSNDEYYMRRAIELAFRGSGWVNPNPLVGAVIVRDGRIIGEGWHTAFGQPHAERHALARCTEDPQGATIYVTLEPCCHTGKQPPCTEALIEAGIARVVMGAPDPNPRVSGGGIAQLEAAGIEVVQGVLVEECQAVNRAFFHYIQTGKPYVILKYAMTLDGKIATRTGASKWITSEVARRRVHEDRQRYAAILVGVGTVLRDDPLLTCRLHDFVFVEEQESDQELRADCSAGADESASSVNTAIHQEESYVPEKLSNPLRVICDSHLRTPLDARVVQTASVVPTCIATTETDQAKHQPYLDRGCTIMVVPEVAGHVDLADLMVQLGASGIDSVIVEGGAEINWSMMESGVVNAIQAYIAPKLFGGVQAPHPLGGLGVETPSEAFKCTHPQITMLGNDVLIECEVI